MSKIENTKYKIMTPGPTMVRDNVLKARSFACTNPDLDMAFYDFYKETCELLSKFMETKNDAFILCGEGILGLEAACASLTERGDRVLVLDNGVFGHGFADFVTIYGGTPVFFTTDYHKPIDASSLKSFLAKDSDFKYATLVHCDTPSGILNDVEKLSEILKEYGIMTVVDSVAGMFGEAISLKENNIDILCGGSQKALSAPPGLTMLWISPDAFNAMERRKTPIASFYLNLLQFKDYYKNKWFPYTMSINDIMGLRVAIENVLADSSIIKRHKIIAEATRYAITKSGLKLYCSEGFSNTVTVFNVPSLTTADEILNTIKEKYGIMIAGSFDVLSGKVIRIGHMGENARYEHVSATLKALSSTLTDLNISEGKNLHEFFSEYIEINNKKSLDL